MKHIQESAVNTVAPPLITVEKLRDHFRHKYQLNETQVEIMIESSSKSLKQGLVQLVQIIDRERSVEGMRAIYHGFKGLFLNMGEREWAEYTKEMEQKLLAGEQLDHGVIAEKLRLGMAEVLAYCGTDDVNPLRKGES
jgi:ribosomal protein S17E